MMTLRGHIDWLHACGFFEKVITESRDDGAPFHDFALMRAEIGVAFPLSRTAEREFFLSVWTASSGLTYGLHAIERAENAEDRKFWEDWTNRQEALFMTVRDTVEAMIQEGRFSAAQVEFLRDDMLAVSLEGIGEKCPA